MNPSVSAKKSPQIHSMILWFTLVSLLVMSSCNADKNTIKNPYPNGKDSIVKKKDTLNYRTIQGLHTGLFKPTCANSGCHDGNFEPDFRTVESTYYNLVAQPVIKLDTQGNFTTRVIPGNAKLSMLLHRMRVDLNGNSGIMPLSLEPNSNYPIEKDTWLARIGLWIDSGAKDWLGRKPPSIDFPPQLQGVQVFSNGSVLTRKSRYEAIEALAGEALQLWFSLSDDKTPISNLTNMRINWSTDPNVFDPLNELPLVKGSVKTMPGLYRSSTDYMWYFDFNGSSTQPFGVYWFRITLNDAGNKDFNLPNSNSMFFIKKYFAVKFN